MIPRPEHVSGPLKPATKTAVADDCKHVATEKQAGLLTWSSEMNFNLF
jgi:hypothetical protein